LQVTPERGSDDLHIVQRIPFRRDPVLAVSQTAPEAANLAWAWRQGQVGWRCRADAPVAIQQADMSAANL
jgi:hypothetical protein